MTVREIDASAVRTVRQPAVLSAVGLLTLYMGAFLSIGDFFIVNVALPTIGADLHASAAMLELVVAGYGVAYALLLVLGGRLGDAFGRRRLFIAGIVAFTITSLACGLAPDAGTLVLARVLQGASAAMMVPQVLSTIQAATSVRTRGRAIAMYGAVGGVGSLAGQLAGGLLVAANLAGTGWRPIFLVNVPIGIIALILALRTVPSTRSHDPARVDVPGTALLGIAVLLLMVPLTTGRTFGWPAWSIAMLVAFPFAAVAFVVLERRQERAGRLPLVPPSLMRVASMRRGLLVSVPFFVGFGGFMFCFAVTLQGDLHMTAWEGGITLAPLGVAYLVTSLSSAWLVDRYGRVVLSVGGAGMAVGFTVLALSAYADWAHLTPLALAPGMVIIGAAQGVVMSPIFRVVLSDVPADRAGAGSGVLITTQQTALAVGVAILGGVFLALSGIDAGRTAFAAILGVEVAVGIVVAIGSHWLPNPTARPARLLASTD
jgi:EmrB/QacA subfamily drug resistance transporter